MSQIGSISISDNINVEAYIAQAKADNPKCTVGSIQTDEKGNKYIPITKNG